MWERRVRAVYVGKDVVKQMLHIADYGWQRFRIIREWAAVAAVKRVKARAKYRFANGPPMAVYEA